MVVAMSKETPRYGLDLGDPARPGILVRAIALPGGATRTTREHTIVGRPSAPGRFNERGDSGSWILSEQGDLAGLLWGGTSSVCYFTPIQMVIADIEARTGMKVELPL